MISDSSRDIIYNIYKNSRLIIIIAFVVIFFIVLVVNLYKIQIRDSSIYTEKGKQQYTAKRNDFDRGKIFFSNKNQKGDLVADTQDVEIIKNDKKIIEKKRIYPYGEIGAKVLGFVAYDQNDKVGRYGIEKYYNDILSRDNEKFWTNFFAEIFGETKGSLIKDEPINEGDIILTIDDEVQKFVYDTLEKTKKEWGSDDIGAIIMNPKDGRIYAMEELSTFDPNKFGKVDDIKVYKNNLVSGVYEMGSIIKPLTVAAALDDGKITTDSFYEDVGDRLLNGKHVRNYDGKARGWVNVQEILSQSLNIGIVRMVELLGNSKFQEYFKTYGIGGETGVDLPNESSGLTSNLDSSIFVNNATAGFGQGIAISPIQTIRALATLGNGGKLVNPYIVDSIEYKDGSIKKIVPDEGVQVFKNKDTSENISRMLTTVVDKALVKGKHKMEHYSVAAKTGTAQIAIPGAGYYEDRYLHSIFAYFPAYDPQYIIFMYHTNPKGAEFASQTLTEPLFKMIDFLISYYGVVPDR